MNETYNIESVPLAASLVPVEPRGCSWRAYDGQRGPAAFVGYNEGVEIAVTGETY